jgi:hypothetical protein
MLHDDDVCEVAAEEGSINVSVDGGQFGTTAEYVVGLTDVLYFGVIAGFGSGLLVGISNSDNIKELVISGNVQAVAECLGFEVGGEGAYRACLNTGAETERLGCEHHVLAQ